MSANEDFKQFHKNYVQHLKDKGVRITTNNKEMIHQKIISKWEQKTGETPSDDEINLSKNGLFLISGNTECGKSVLLMYLLQLAMLRKNPLFQKILLYCPTFQMQPLYRETLPVEWCKSNFDLKDEMDRLFLSQEQEFINKGSNKRILVIVDDVVGLMGSSMTLERMASSGRHFNMTIIVLTQHLKGLVSPTIRSNCRYMICGKCIDSSREVIIENIPQNVIARRDAREYIDKQFSIPHNFVVISNCNQKELFTYKVDISKLQKNFRIKLNNGNKNAEEESEPIPDVYQRF